MHAALNARYKFYSNLKAPYEIKEILLHKYLFYHFKEIFIVKEFRVQFNIYSVVLDFIVVWLQSSQ